MKTIESQLSMDLCNYPLTLIGPLEDLLFVDIETTGFTARTSNLYLIGCIYFENKNAHLIQWFAETLDEEENVLKAFQEKCRKHKILIHYNGNNFDIPYMKQKCLQYRINEPFSSMTGVDIYKRIMPYKKSLFLDNLKQKTVEKFLGIDREDKYNGGELISFYKDYVKAPDPNTLKLLLLHNADDMRGMFSLMPILSYADMFLHPFRVTKVQSTRYENPDGKVDTEVAMKLRFPFSFPKTVSFVSHGCRLHLNENEGMLKVPIIYGELKYFYSNYKDYYYLPDEDMAVHKSVATFVDKTHRIQASASNCYTKKTSAFLPQWDMIFSPIFKKDYSDKIFYFELTDDMKHSPKEFSKYALHILDMLAHSKDS